MINNKDIVVRIGNALKPKRVSFDKRPTHPVREWVTGLLFFVIIVGAGGTYNAIMFVNYRSINTHESTGPESIIRYNKVLVQNVLETYSNRKATFDSLRAELVPQPPLEEALPDTSVDTATTTATTSPEATENQGETTLRAI